MKFFKTILIFIFLFLSLIKISFANIFFQKNDTIKIKTTNNIHINIIAEDSVIVLNNINEIISQINDNLNEIKENKNLFVNDSTITFFFPDNNKSDINENNNNYEKFQNNTLRRFWNYLLIKNLKYNIYDKKSIAKYSIFFDLGLINYLGDWQIPRINKYQYALNQFASFNINIGGSLRLRFANVFSMNLEACFASNFYSFKDRSTILTTENDQINFSQRSVSFNDSYSFAKSRLIVPSIDIAVLPIFHIIRRKEVSNTEIVNVFNMRLGIGIFGGYRLASTVKYQYIIDLVEQRYSEKGDYYLNKYHYGIKTIIGFGNYFDIYFKYYLNSLFKKNKANSLNTMSLGIRFSI